MIFNEFLNGFWEASWGRKWSKKSIKEGIEKVMKKGRAQRWQKSPAEYPRDRRKLGCGKGVGGRVNPSPEEGKVVCSMPS